MGKDHKRYLRAVLVIFIAAFCNMKLPHSSKSIIQYIIPPIKTGEGSRLYLSGVPIIIAVLWSYKEIIKSNYCDTNKVLRFILIFFIILPTVFKGINGIKRPYYTFNGGLKTMDIIDSNLDLEFDGEFKDQIRIQLHIKNYSNETQRFNISLGIPESLGTIISEPTIMLKNKYSGGAQGGNIYVDELIEFNYVPGFSRENLINTFYYYDNYEINLFNENDELVITLNDSL